MAGVYSRWDYTGHVPLRARLSLAFLLSCGLYVVPLLTAHATGAFEIGRAHV